MDHNEDNQVDLVVFNEESANQDVDIGDGEECLQREKDDGDETLDESEVFDFGETVFGVASVQPQHDQY